MKNLTKITLTIFAIATIAAEVKATPLLPGTAALPAVSSIAVGATLVASSSVGFVNGSVDGVFNSYVFNEHLGGGALTFVYEVQNNGAGTAAFSRFAMANFAGYSVDVYQSSTIPGSGVIGGTLMTTADRSSFADDGGDVVGANFLPKLPNGSNSYWLIVRTNATGFVLDTAGVIDGRTVNPAAYLPTGPAAVPDGGSAVALLGISLAGIEGVRRIIRARKA